MLFRVPFFQKVPFFNLESPKLLLHRGPEKFGRQSLQICFAPTEENLDTKGFNCKRGNVHA